MFPVADWRTPGTTTHLVHALLAERYPRDFARLQPLLIRCELEDLQLLMAASPFVRDAEELEAILISYLEGDGELPQVMLGRLAPDDRMWACSRDAGELTLRWLHEARTPDAEVEPDAIDDVGRTAG